MIFGLDFSLSLGRDGETEGPARRLAVGSRRSSFWADLNDICGKISRNNYFFCYSAVTTIFTRCMSLLEIRIFAANAEFSSDLSFLQEISIL